MTKRTFDDFMNFLDPHQFMALMRECPNPSKARAYYNDLMGFDKEEPEFVSSRDTDNDTTAVEDSWPPELREFVESLEAEGHTVIVHEIDLDDPDEQCFAVDGMDEIMAEIGATIMGEAPENMFTTGFDLGDEDETVVGLDDFDTVLADFIRGNLESGLSEQLLPEWAAKGCLGNPVIERMTQLCTRNGNIVGNATIFDIVYNAEINEAQFWIITDAKNVLKLSFNEMVELFHIPKYVMKDFLNNEDNSVGEFLNDWYIDNAGYSVDSFS